MGLAGIDELRQEGHEEDRQLGIEEIDQDGGDDHLQRRAPAGRRFDLERAVLLQRHPGEVEQIGDAGILEDLEGDGAGMEQRGKPEDGGSHVGDDAERAAEGGDDAGAGAAREAGGKRVEDAGAGRGDDDERGEEEFEMHGTDAAMEGLAAILAPAGPRRQPEKRLSAYSAAATARLAITLTRLAR